MLVMSHPKAHFEAWLSRFCILFAVYSAVHSSTKNVRRLCNNWMSLQVIAHFMT